MICIDASVFVASARASEPGHAASNQFFETVITEGEKVCCPALVLPECAAALARRTDRTEMGEEIVWFIQTFPRIRLEPLTLQRTERAAEIAAHHRLRGADAIYAATAAQ